jgi:hypothetical protein
MLHTSKKNASSLGAFAILLIYFKSSSALSSDNDTLLDENGNPLVLLGASWFGFNNGATMVRLAVNSHFVNLGTL